MNEILIFFSENKVTISLALLVLLLAWETIDPFFKQLTTIKDRSWHGIKNLALQALNALMIILVFIALWAWAAELSKTTGFGLLHLLELNTFVELLLALILFDVWTYWWHRMSHRIPFLWRFHRVHHSDNKMDVTSANRFHIGEILISSLLRIVVIFLIGAELSHIAIYEALMFPVVQFHHANIALPIWLDSFLRLFIPTPAMHKVHHSRVPVETDSNYSSMLSIWDRVFGSFRLQENQEGIKLGLKGYDTEEKQSLLGMLKEPFQK